MKLSFHGAAGTVTGSCYLLTTDTSKIVIDCGLFQGSPELEQLNSEPFGFTPSEATGMLLTHAHLDHCGRIPKLVREGFNGPIYMNQATYDLLEIALNDAAKVMAEHKEKAAIYSEDDVIKTLQMAHIIEYNTPFQFGGFSITYVNAGHILGSASIILEGFGKRIAFSGDLGNSPQDLIEPTEYITNADIVVMESTYGDRNHPDEDPTTVLQEEINAVEKTGAALLIPAFSLERTQELLHKIDHLKKKGLVKEETVVYMDSPMAIRATDVFRAHPELYNEELKNHLETDDPFSFTGLQVTQRGKDSVRIKNQPGTKVIIAGSGMMTGGRILNHAANYLPDSKTHLLIVGFQAEHTIGRQITEGATHVKVYGQDVAVNAVVRESHAMSSHADQTGLLTWIKHVANPQRLFLTHGEDGPREALKLKITDIHQSVHIETPHLHDEVEL